MLSFFSKPPVLKTVRYAAAYSLFILFAALGLVIAIIFRSNVVNLLALLKVKAHTASIIYTWGTYVLIAPYFLFIGLLESYLNKAAQKGIMRQRALKVLVIEGGIGIIFLAIMLVFAYPLNLPPLY